MLSLRCQRFPILLQTITLLSNLSSFLLDFAMKRNPCFASIGICGNQIIRAIRNFLLKLDHQSTLLFLAKIVTLGHFGQFSILVFIAPEEQR
ncbi:hypothetical protein Pan97_07390 [Bremerella volcania]|uniref:Uncharacterized protein n=1 Tax=Bremerella volcania TaxID=2527984 RepID=A0A518C3D6_9BACT|nr:hypothetical protein Pan97_07390 [Bremerella volcania]